jgi:hypothetical protein
MTKNTYSVINSTFSKLGISQLACDVYQFFLFNPGKNITDCAKDLSLHRFKVYELLEELQKYKLAQHKDKKISIEPPSALASLLEYNSLVLNTQLHELQQVIPRIEEENIFINDSLVQIYARKNEFLEIFHRILSESSRDSEFCVYANMDDFFGIIDLDYFNKYFTPTRIKKNIFSKILCCGNVSTKSLEAFKITKEYKRDVKYLMEENKSGATYWVIEDKVVFWNTQLVRAIVIKDQAVANLMRQSFNILWGKASEVYTER